MAFVSSSFLFLSHFEFNSYFNLLDIVVQDNFTSAIDNFTSAIDSIRFYSYNPLCTSFADTQSTTSGNPLSSCKRSYPVKNIDDCGDKQFLALALVSLLSALYRRCQSKQSKKRGAWIWWLLKIWLNQSRDIESLVDSNLSRLDARRTKRSISRDLRARMFNKQTCCCFLLDNKIPCKLVLFLTLEITKKWNTRGVRTRYGIIVSILPRQFIIHNFNLEHPKQKILTKWSPLSYYLL